MNQTHLQVVATPWKQPQDTDPLLMTLPVNSLIEN